MKLARLDRHTPCKRCRGWGFRPVGKGDDPKHGCEACMARCCCCGKWEEPHTMDKDGNCPCCTVFNEVI